MSISNIKYRARDKNLSFRGDSEKALRRRLQGEGAWTKPIAGVINSHLEIRFGLVKKTLHIYTYI